MNVLLKYMFVELASQKIRFDNEARGNSKIAVAFVWSYLAAECAMVVLQL